ncbi:MAG TPA: endo-1,4-beta-xylanase [Caulobacteraceae bacterium]|nr:endo-1,4-beta-xylanase [Caulobacteraceae bacterium]
MSASRRALLGSAIALAACGRRAGGQQPRLPAPLDLPPLKRVAPFPVGTCITSSQLDDLAFAGFVARQVSQLTPEWELKMEYVVQADGSYRFDAPDRIAAFAGDRGLRFFGHALIWYAQGPAAFARLDGGAFRDAYAAYIAAVVGRYKGRAVAWDVVNEAVAEDGDGWRSSLWSQRLGTLEHMRLAYQIAHAADPGAALFLNDYNLESNPRKRATFLKLAETLLRAGAPLTGLGSQTHVAADLAPGAITAALKDLASLGLKVRISEMDVSLSRASGGDRERRQAALYAEAAAAYAALSAARRFDFSFWGLRDSQSWLRREHADDAPLLFDDQDRPKAAAAAWERALPRRA